MKIGLTAALVAMSVMIVLQLRSFSFCDAFAFATVVNRSSTLVLQHPHAGTARRMSRMALKGRRKGMDEEGDENDLPQLPALGAASHSLGNSLGSNPSTENGPRSSPTLASNRITNSTSTSAFVSPKFELQYTCNVCETRNRVLISRQAYREGMVIAICKGCDAKHWIADNLDPTLKSNNIEELFAANASGQEGSDDVQQVSRVTREVYDIERVWQFKGGEMQDENGNPVLE
jgi:protein import protein ZIM17